MPSVSDQKNAVPVPVASVLNPTTSPAALIARGDVLSPPNVASSREPPAAYQMMPRWHWDADVQGTCTLPTRSPAALAPTTKPGRESSCSTCHAPPDRVQRTGTKDVPDPAPPPTIVPSPLMALALVVPPATSGGR